MWIELCLKTCIYKWCHVKWSEILSSFFCPQTSISLIPHCVPSVHLCVCVCVCWGWGDVCGCMCGGYVCWGVWGGIMCIVCVMCACMCVCVYMHTWCMHVCVCVFCLSHTFVIPGQKTSRSWVCNQPAVAQYVWQHSSPRHHHHWHHGACELALYSFSEKTLSFWFSGKSSKLSNWNVKV